MKLRLQDDSTLTVQVDSKRIPLKTPYGKLSIPRGALHTLQSDPANKVVRVKMPNGDRFSGSISAPQLKITHALGELRVPWDEVTELSLASGKDSERSITSLPTLSSPVRFEVSLRDGSAVLASPMETSATLTSAFGATALPWTLVRSVTFRDEGQASTVRFWNGDVLTGQIDWATCPVITGLGSGIIDPVRSSRLSVSLGGTDLVARPHTAASGSSYFLSAIKSNSPQRIGGQHLPSSQFINAHASGRIEYTFDEPITEFRAIAAMYESYGAHKGRVIFRVETEHGQVYATRPIHNLQREEIYAKFKPARKLVLITDQNGSQDEDWSVWLRPEVR